MKPDAGEVKDRLVMTCKRLREENAALKSAIESWKKEELINIEVQKENAQLKELVDAAADVLDRYEYEGWHERAKQWLD